MSSRIRMTPSKIWEMVDFAKMILPNQAVKMRVAITHTFWIKSRMIRIGMPMYQTSTLIDLGIGCDTVLLPFSSSRTISAGIKPARRWC
jgi:hypothetical protein